jgi:hypothetical protein
MCTGNESTQRSPAAVHASQDVELAEPNSKIVESSFDKQEHHHGCPALACLQ